MITQPLSDNAKFILSTVLESDDPEMAIKKATVEVMNQGSSSDEMYRAIRALEEIILHSLDENTTDLASKIAAK